jgi:hypothetical protein
MHNDEPDYKILSRAVILPAGFANEVAVEVEKYREALYQELQPLTPLKKMQVDSCLANFSNVALFSYVETLAFARQSPGHADDPLHSPAHYEETIAKGKAILATCERMRNEILNTGSLREQTFEEVRNDDSLDPLFRYRVVGSQLLARSLPDSQVDSMGEMVQAELRLNLLDDIEENMKANADSIAAAESSLKLASDMARIRIPAAGEIELVSRMKANAQRWLSRSFHDLQTTVPAPRPGGSGSRSLADVRAQAMPYVIEVLFAVTHDTPITVGEVASRAMSMAKAQNVELQLTAKSAGEIVRSLRVPLRRTADGWKIDFGPPEIKKIHRLRWQQQGPVPFSARSGCKDCDEVQREARSTGATTT